MDGGGIGKRINAERMDEAAATGADTVGVACPYCLIMLDDGAKGRGDTTEVLDIAQVVRRSLPDESPAHDYAHARLTLLDPGHFSSR